MMIITSKEPNYIATKKITKRAHHVLFKFRVLCWAAFIVLTPTGHRLGTSELLVSQGPELRTHRSYLPCNGFDCENTVWGKAVLQQETLKTVTHTRHFGQCHSAKCRVLFPSCVGQQDLLCKLPTGLCSFQFSLLSSLACQVLKTFL